MKIIMASLAVTLFLIIGKFFVLPVFAVSAINVPHYLTFEGQLTNSAGTYQTNTFSMVFTIYDALTGGTALWTETQPTVSVASGYFTAQLGSVTALSLDFSKQYWITVNVASDGEMTPRIPLNSVGYSYASDVAYGTYSTTTAPTTGAGKLYYNSTEGNLYVYDDVGDAWRDLTAGVGGAGLTDNNAFTGQNTFSATTTMATSTMTGLLVSTTSTLSGTLNIGAVLQGGTPLVFEGATANDFETSFVITDSTADRTITFPNDDGTVVLASALPTYGQVLVGNSSSGYTLSATSSLKIALTDTTGTLAVNRGGTNLTSYTANQLLYASDTGTIGQIATSSLGLLTTNVAEGTGLYWTNDRFDTRLATTTTLPNLTTLLGLASVTSTGVTATNFWTTNLAYLNGGLIAGGTSSTISGLSVTSTGNLVSLLAPTYLRIGDAGVTSRSFNTNDDLFVSGRLEIDGLAYFDSTLNISGNGAIVANNGYLFFGSNGATDSGFYPWETSHATAEFVWNLGTDLGRAVVFGATSNSSKSYDHALQPDPTLFIHSSTDPDTDNQEYIGFSVSSTLNRAVMETGATVDLGFSPSSTGAMLLSAAGNLGIGTTTPQYKLVINSSNATDNLFQIATTTNQGVFVINSAGNLSMTGKVQSGTWNGTAVGADYGGTGLTSYAPGDLIYASTATTLAKLVTSTPGSVLITNFSTGLPAYVTTSTLKIALSDTTGTLAVNRGGTNLTTYTANGLLYASDTGTIGQITTSTLGLLTTNVAEGTGLYWTNDRFDTRLATTTTLPNLTTLLGLASVTSTGVTATNFWTTNLAYLNGGLIAGGTSSTISGLSVTSTGNLVSLLAPTYLRIGDAGVTNRSLSANDDLFVSGKFEADGTISLDGTTALNGLTTVSGNGMMVANNGYISFGSNASTDAAFSITESPSYQFELNLGTDTGRALVVMDMDDRTADYNHPAQPDPTIFIHSSSSPAVSNQEYIGISVSSTLKQAIIQTGSGIDIGFSPAASSTVVMLLSTAGKLGIGTTVPSSTLHIVTSTEQLRLASNVSTGYLSLTHDGAQGVLDTGNNSGLRFSMYDTAASTATVASSTYLRFEASGWDVDGGVAVSVSTTLQLVPVSGNNVVSYLQFTDTGTQYARFGKSGTNTTPYLAGEATDGSSAIGLSVGAVNNFVTAGSKLLSIRNNIGTAGGTEVAYFDYLGGLVTGGPSSTISGLAVTSTASTIDLVSQGRYLRIGDAGFTNQSLSANDDLLVSGKLEVDGFSFMDATSTLSKLGTATAGVTTYTSSPLVFNSSAWDTAVAQTVDFRESVIPSSLATPTGKLSWQYSLNGAAYGEKMSLTSAGTLTVVQDFSARSGVVQMGEFVASTPAGSGGWFWYNSATNSKPDGLYNYFLANSGTNVAHVLDNTNALSGSTKILSVRTANKEVAFIGGDNSFGIGNGTATTTIYGSSTSTFPYGATFASTNGQVGIGAGATYPSSTLHVVSSGLDQLRLGNDTNTKYLSLTHNGIEGVLDTGNNSGLRLSMYDTAAATLTVASSTYLRFEASAWNTTGGGSVNTVSTTIQLVPRSATSVTSYLNFIDTGTQYLVIGKAGNAAVPYFAGQVADGSSAIGLTLGSWNNFTTVGSKLVSFKSNISASGGVEQGYFGATGTMYVATGIRPGLDNVTAEISTSTHGGGTTIMYIGNAQITTGSSDVRMKENISDSTINALSVLKGLHLVDFDWKPGIKYSGQGRATGMIAQELYSFLPQVVSKPENEENMWAIDYPQMVPYVIKAVLEQQAEIQALSLNNLQGNPNGNVNQDALSVVDMNFPGKLKVKGQVAFGQDTVGQAKILVGATEVQVNFSAPYEYQPIVTLTLASDANLTKYYVSSASSTGFIIKVEPQQMEKDVLFNWHAFGSDGEMPLPITETPVTIVEPVIPPVVSEAEPSAPTIETPPSAPEAPIESAPAPPAPETPPAPPAEAPPAEPPVVSATEPPMVSQAEPQN